MSNQPQAPKTKPTGLSAFWAELKRRHVVRVGIVYTIVGWLVIQVANATFEEFGIPLWAYRFVVLMVVLGFPISVVLAWAFELTPEGIKTTKKALKESKGTEESASHAKKRNWFSLIFAAAVPTLIFGTLALFFHFRSSSSLTPDTRHLTPGLGTSDKSIAVLPLDNLSPDAENAFFAGGVHEDILTNLSKIKDLRVISRTSTLDYGANRSGKKSSEIADELNVRYLVEGSVRRAGNQVRVTVQLIDGPKDEHLWADNYDRPLDDIFAIQSEIAKAIAQQIHAAIAPEELARIESIPTKNQAAYDLYVKAQAEKYKAAGFGWPLESMKQAIAYLEEAVALDPQFALGYTFLAYMHSIVHWFYSKDYPGTLEKARHYLEKAEVLDPSLAELYLNRGYYYYWGFLDYARAAEEFALALSVQPNLAEGFYALSLVQRRQSREMEALENQLRGLQLDPRSPQLLNGLSDSYAHFRRYAEAMVVAEKLSGLNPSEVRFQIKKYEVQFYLTGELSHYMTMRQIFWQGRRGTGFNFSFYDEIFDPYFEAMHRGQFKSALDSIESTEKDSAVSPFYWNALRARALWLLGRQAQARDAAQKVIDESALMDWTMDKANAELRTWLWELSWLAEMYAIQGNREKTVEYRETVRRGLIGTRSEHRSRDIAESHLLPSYLALGETEEAFEILDDLMSRPGQLHAQEFRIDPWWRSFHGDQRFEAILAKAAPVEE